MKIPGAYLILLVGIASACSSQLSPPLLDVAPATTLVRDTPAVATTEVPNTPTTTTTTTAAADAPATTLRTRLVVNGVGDVNLDPGFVGSFSEKGYDDVWAGIFGAFSRDDITIINLECSPSRLGSPWPKLWNFRCDVDALPAMAAAGVDVANLANNHAMDFGFDAMLDGQRNLLNVGILPVGTGINVDAAYRPVILERNGWTVAIIGSGGANPESGSWIALPDRPGMTHGDDTESIAEAVRSASQVADLVFVTAHWGKQDSTRPLRFERAQAEAWIEAGADGIFGHHQHVLQPLGWYLGRPIAWGLGNFVWQAASREWRQSAIAQFVFEPDGRISACLIPVTIERHAHPVVQDPSVPVCAPSGPQ